MKKSAIVILELVLLCSMTAFAGSNFKFNQPQSMTYNITHQKAVAANTTLTLSDDTIYVDCSGGARTITLPPIYSTNGINGKSYNIVKIDTSANDVIVTASTSDVVTNTIEGAATRHIAIANGQLIIKLNSGSDWSEVWETAPINANMTTGVISMPSYTGSANTILCLKYDGSIGVCSATTGTTGVNCTCN